MDLKPEHWSKEARLLNEMWHLRLIPAVMIGSLVGAGLATLPFDVGLYMFFAPLFGWVYWRLIFWKNWPEKRLVTVAVPLTAAMVVVAIAAQRH
jgi:hypothetical protein